MRLLLQRFGLAALSALSAACTYSSDYVPPQDGRARVLFQGDEAVASLPPVDPACLSAIQGAPESPRYVVRRRGGVGVSIYWVPVIHTRVSHPHPRVVSGGATVRHAATPVVRSGGASGSGGTRVSAGRSSGGGGKPSSSGKSGSGGGGSSDGKALALVAVVVLLALPVVTLALAASSPESGHNAANAIDEVNAYNDLARTPGAPCAPEMIVEEVEPSLDAPPPEAPAPEVSP